MGRGVLLECLRHVFEVLMHRRLLIVYRTRQSTSSFTHFSQRTVTCGTNLSIKGTWPYKYQPSRLSVSCPLSSWLSYLGYEQASVWNRAAMGLYFLLTLMAVSMCLRTQFTSAWYVAYFVKIDFQIQHCAWR